MSKEWICTHCTYKSDRWLDAVEHEYMHKHFVVAEEDVE
jgi:hypothetical protein